MTLRTITAAHADVSCSLLEFDFSGIEAVLTGRCLWAHGFSSDGAKQYIRLARLGMHAAVTALKVGTPVDLTADDQTVKGQLDAVKKAHPKAYDTSKRTVHANNFGMTTYGMVEKFPEFFPTLKAAQEFQGFYYALAPDLPKWHQALRKTAHERGFLGGVTPPGAPTPSIWDHPYGYRHWFWDVLSYQPCQEFTARKWLKDPTRAHRIVYLHGRPFQVRFGGDGNRCLPPDAQVWMGDYTYKPIGEIKVGDVVIGWQRGKETRRQQPAAVKTHYANKNKKYANKNKKYSTDHLVRATVTATHEFTDQTLTIRFASGRSIRCTADHQWLTYVRNCYEWYTAADLRVGDHVARVDVVDPGDCPTALQETAAWLGGFYDGEGALNGVTQVNTNPGNTLETAEAAFAALGFATTRRPLQAGHEKWKDSSFLAWEGGRQAALKFARWVPSARYRAQYADRMILTSRFRRLDQIVAIESNPVAEPVICVTTTTGNFIADGLCSHNCIAFYPQSTAAGRLKEAQRRLFMPWSDDFIGDVYFGRTPLLGPIHDSLLLQVPNRCVDRVAEIVGRVMQEPSPRLPIPIEWGWGGYLPIGVNAKIGKNWAERIDAATQETLLTKTGKAVSLNVGGMEDLKLEPWVAPSAASAVAAPPPAILQEPDHSTLPVDGVDDEDAWKALERSVT